MGRIVNLRASLPIAQTFSVSAYKNYKNWGIQNADAATGCSCVQEEEWGIKNGELRAGETITESSQLYTSKTFVT